MIRRIITLFTLLVVISSCKAQMALILLNMQGNRMNYLVHTKNSIIKLRHSKKSDDTIIINLVLVFGSYTMKMAI